MQGEIIYALVAREGTILCELAHRSGNFATIARKIVAKVPKDQAKMSYQYDKYLFHFVQDDGILFMCMADENFGRRVPYQFLEKVKGLFFSAYAKTAKTMPRCNDFSSVLKKQVEHYNSPDADSITRIKSEIENVKTTMISNIDQVLENSEKIDILVEKSDALSTEATTFKKSSTTLRRQMCKRNLMLTAMVVGALAILIFIIVLIACGGFSFERCKKSKK